MAPASPIEQTLVDIWKMVLKLDRVGIRDDFFCSRWRLLDKHPDRFSRRDVKGSRSNRPACSNFRPSSLLFDRWSDRTKLRRSWMWSTSRLFFMVHGGERMREYLQDAIGDRFTVHQFDDHWDDGCLSPTTSIQGMADDYLADLKAMAPNGPYLLGGYSIGAAVSVVMAKRLMAAGEQVEFLFLLDPLHMIEFFNGVEGLDHDTLNALSATPPTESASTSLMPALKHRLSGSVEAAPSVLFKIYTRYLRGPSRLIRGALAYYSGRPLSPQDCQSLRMGSSTISRSGSISFPLILGGSWCSGQSSIAISTRTISGPSLQRASMLKNISIVSISRFAAIPILSKNGHNGSLSICAGCCERLR